MSGTCYWQTPPQPIKNENRTAIEKKKQLCCISDNIDFIEETTENAKFNY